MGTAPPQITLRYGCSISHACLASVCALMLPPSLLPPGACSTVVDVAPRVRAWDAQNRMAAHTTDWGRLETIVPAAWEDCSGEARVSVPGPEVTDAEAHWMTSWFPAS